jgi:glycosyltransferase involved in cell wall biosynthesis
MPSVARADPVASVIVIGYNQANFISQAILSVLTQSNFRIECIFVSDGSTDCSLDIVRDIAETDSRLRTFSISNSGPSKARNYGYSQITNSSKYVCFLDGDDFLRPHFIEVCIDYLERHEDVGVVLPSFDRVDGAGNIIPTPPRIRWAPGVLWLPRLLPETQPETPFVTFYCGSGVTPFWLARRSIFEKTKGWDEGLWPYEDTDILCQLSMLTKVHSVTSRLVGYRQHPHQSTAGGAQRSRHWKEHGLATMQTKWDAKPSSSLAEVRVLNRACIYYHQVHQPLRNLFVAQRAFRDFVRNPSVARFKWFSQLVFWFFVDFSYYKFFFWRSTRRWRATRPPA